MNRAAPLAWTALLSTATALLYFHQLGSSAPYLSIDEVFQARDAVVLAATGRNLNGQLFPLYFPDPGLPAGRDPVFIYVTAALLRVLPFSQAVARAPSAAAGVLNVVLMFIVGRAIFGRTRLAVIAAGLLMLTPAHFLQSRIGHNQIGTLTCALAWLLFLVRYINTHRHRDLFVATLCLGVGMYTYASGLVIMPVYFLVTLFIVRQRAADARPAAALRTALAGFALAALPLALWYMLHPERAAQLAVNYTHGEYNRNLGLKGFLGAGAISHLDAWWDCYNPDKLFFSGDADLRFSTRSAGYFLLSASVPMGAGVWFARRFLKFETWIVILSGLVLAPVPAAVVSGSEVKRWLTFLPFAILVATCGVHWLLAGGRRAVRACAIGLLLIGRWLTLIPSAILLAACGALWMLAERRSAAKACAIALLLLGMIQTESFLDYYFGQYRIDSSDYFGGNVRDAIREVVSVSTLQDCILLDTRVYYLEDQWDLYTRAYGRADLATRTSWLNPDAAANPPASCRGTTVLALAGDPRFTGWRSTQIPELNGTVRFAVYRRDAS